MGNAKDFVSVGRGAQYLLPLQQPGDLAGSLPGGAQGEDAAHHGGGLLVHHQLLVVLFVLAVTIGRSGAQPLPALRLSPLHRPDLPAGVPDEPLIKQVLEGHQLRALAPIGVHIVVDGDVADAEHGKPLLDVKPRVELVASQPGQILGDDGADLPVFHIRHHLLEAGAVEAAPGIAVIHIKAGVGEAVLPCVPLQDIPLVLDAVGLSVRPVILAKTAVQGGDLILV